MVLQGKVPWCDVVRCSRLGDGWAQGRMHLENGIIYDIAEALGIDSTRLHIQR